MIFQNKLPDAGKGEAQESDHELLFGSICKKYIPVRDASAIPWAMREAYRVARTGRPGPVVVDLYRDVVENQKAEYIQQNPKGYCVMPEYVASDEMLDAAKKVIGDKRKICLWVGNGVKRAKAAREVEELSELLKAPIVCTYNGIGAIDSTFPNFIGPRSRHGSKVTQAVIEEAECTLVIGSTLTAISTNRWGIKPQELIQFDIIPENIGRHYPVATGVVGDAKRSLRSLLNVLKAEGYKGDSQFLEDMQRRKAEWKEELFQGAIGDDMATPVQPLALQKQLEKVLKADSVFCVDAGNPGAWTHATAFPENISYMKPVNFGNMGFALGASIGCQLACPEKEVVALLGDGSLGMTLGELETIGREKLPIIVLLVNDSAYGNIKQEELFKMGEGRYTGVDFPEIDYVNVARALGMEGCIVEKASEIPAAFEEARRCGKPFMIEVKLDGSFSVWPEAV